MFIINEYVIFRISHLEVGLHYLYMDGGGILIIFLIGVDVKYVCLLVGDIVYTLYDFDKLYLFFLEVC